jgi:hypothetical protein
VLIVLIVLLQAVLQGLLLQQQLVQISHTCGQTQ